MNQTRTFLLFAWLLVGFLIWQAWQVDYHTPPAADAVSDASMATLNADSELPATASGVPATALPPTNEVDPSLPPPPSVATTPTDIETATPAPNLAPITVTTDVLRVSIDPRGASLVRAELLAYPQTTKPGAPAVELFSTERGRYFSAQSGWMSTGGPSPNHQQVYTSAASEYALSGDATRLEVPFEWTEPSGLRLTKTLVFTRGSYVVEVKERFENRSASGWIGYPYQQLQREPPPSAGGGLTNPEAYSFVGAAWFTPEAKFNKLGFDDFEPKVPLDVAGAGGWIAMLQHYFFAAWIPDAAQATRFNTTLVNGRRVIRSAAPTIEIAAGSAAESVNRLYVGPKLQDQMAGVAPGLERTIDYGVLTVLAEPLFWLLSLFHGLTGNWGWAIIFLVIVIKAAFFKLSEAQYKSFARMRAVQPRIEALKERYGDDKQKFNMAMMELYKKEKINPMGGCLPILVQIPVFIALYWVLLESVELRHAPWMLWIQNLSAPDPFFVLPVLNLVTMWLTQKLSPSPGMDPMQKKMMQYMPIIFGVMFAFFPAGLVLYWTVNGGLGLLQQWVINRRHGEAKA